MADNIKNVTKVLLNSLSAELVHMAFENLNKASSPRLDGLPTEIFVALLCICHCVRAKCFIRGGYTYLTRKL